eukprot:gnl/MRDRNA2_/MRDRNA2_95468_c0_seq1.p1 gnl/MRDRNA2_/MRDRNA2_95468_c0~~gnl/MRDRNA2_/MRDRNA2_95468_c0_seq1.p1  ORF type:complete len:449 (-),score=73.62 gnl/MRDRNA2_/MRDRNA2_95468_c0_seq1:176-1381(-)
MGNLCKGELHNELSTAAGADEDLDGQYEFQSVHDLVPGCVLFGDTSPNDLQQGGLGDCWLLSAFASIAEYPQFVESLITDNGDSTYQVHLYSYEKGSFISIGVDDCFPAVGPGYQNPLAYCHVSKEKEFWPCVLEKAIAKLAGGYAEINGGHSSWAFGMLTGCTDLETIHMEGGTATVNEYASPPETDTPHDWGGSYYVGDEIDADGLMDLLVDYAESQKYLMCAGSQAGSDSDFSAGHIVQGHAYTILAAAKAPAGQEDVNLVKLRNPWGSDEWNGAWSDGDGMWDQYPDVAAELGHEEREDGAFWMPLESFMQQYSCIYVCKKSMSGQSTHSTQKKHTEDQHDEADGGFQYYEGKYPYYWKAEEGYDPYTDGYYYYYADYYEGYPYDEDSAVWYSVPQK